MKLTSIEIHPDNSLTPAVLSFRDPRAENPYNVKAIVGLDADEIMPRYYGAYGNPKFYNMVLEKRTVVMRIQLNPSVSTGQTISDLRDNLYKIISASRSGKLQLQFKNGSTVVAAIEGFVRKFEAAHFEKTQEVQITIECIDAMLRSLNAVNVSVAGLDPDNTIITDSLSTAPHGFKAEILINSDMAYILLVYYDDILSGIAIGPTGGFLAGDVLHISSEDNDKYVYVMR